MGETITLTAEDGHRLAAYLAKPKGAPKGGIVVVQEIFGVNNHIRNVCDGFAADGYVAVAPAVFDRVKTGVELKYDQDGIAEGRELVGKLGWDGPMQDIAAAAKEAGKHGRVGVVGYCWGGSAAWLASTRLALPAVGYYGGRTAGLVDEQPQAPVMLIFGDQDTAIPMTDVDKIRAAHADVPVHVYPAGHGFNCDERASYDAAAAKAAREKTMAFFAEHVG